MVIVGGWFEVDPSERDAFVAQRVEAMRRSRAEHGCIEYVIAVSNDPRWLSIDLSVQAVDGFDTDQAIAKFDQAVAELTWSDSALLEDGQAG